EMIGDGMATAGYLPGATAGAGSLTVNSGAGDRSISFSGLETATADALSSLTLTTPKSNDVLTVDQPAGGQNRVLGTSGGVTLPPLTFFDVTTFTVDTGANDGAQADDSLTIGAAGLTATGLTNFVFKGGPGNDQLTVAGTNYTTPGSSTGISFQGGSGTNTFDISGWTGTGSLTGNGGTTDRVVATANANFTLSDALLTVTGRANMTLASIERATLTGGGGANLFTVAGWTGAATLDG